MGVLYRRIDDFSENVDEWRPLGFWRSFMFLFFPAKLCNNFTHEFSDTNT